MKFTISWRPILVMIGAIAIIGLQLYAFINVETPPVSFKDEIIPGEYSICRGSALHYKNTFVINHKSPVVYIRSVAKGFVTNPDVPHVTVQQDDKPLYFNVWEPQERVNTLVYTPTIIRACISRKPLKVHAPFVACIFVGRQYAARLAAMLKATIL